MKTNRHIGIAVAGVLAFAAGAAHADTVAQWTFESSAPTTAGPFAAEVGSGSATGSHSTASTYSAPAGNGSAHSFSSTAWSVGDYYQFSVSTLGLKDVSLSWDQTSSNTGPKDFTLQYSTDGSHFSTFNSYSVLANGASPNPAWSSGGARSAAYTFSDDLSSISAINNVTNLFFRLVDADTTAANGGTVGSGGTDRVDNVIVTASPVPVPAAIWLLGSGLFGFARLRRRQSAG
jgi:hypothetical protein